MLSAVDFIRVRDLAHPFAGDFNNNGIVNAADIDLLCAAIDASGTAPTATFDVNGDGTVDIDDLTHQVEVILQTSFGDTDTDGDVDLADLGNLASGFGMAGEKRWSKGNFDCDDDVDLSDLGTLASNFEGGSAQAYAAFQTLVPEPACALMFAILPGMLLRARRGDA